MNDINKIKKPLEDSGVLTDEVTETVKHNKKIETWERISWKRERPVISPVVKRISGGGVRQARTWYIDRIFSSAPSFRQYQDY